VETRRITHIPEWDAGLDESQAGIKIAQRNINNLGYADDTTLMAEGEKELKSLLMKVKMESKKAGLKCNIQKTKIMASSPITSWQADGEKIGNSKRSYYLGLQNHCRWWLQPWNQNMLAPWKKSMTNLDSILKSRDITLLTKVHIVKAMVFPVITYRCESWIIRLNVEELMLANCGAREDSW